MLCTSGCDLCSNSGLDSCTSCETYNGTIYYLVDGTTTCGLSCPDGQYESPGDNRCYPCDVNCHTCDIAATNCTSCYLTTTGIRLFLENFMCVQTCGEAMYKNTTNNTCLPCHDGCLVCTGDTLSDCQACRNATDPANASNLLEYYLWIGNSVCDLVCPLGQYIREGYPNYCQACAVQCIGCSVTSTNCTIDNLCTVGYYFYVPTNSCLTTCPGGYYANDTTRRCEECVAGCSLCTAGDLLNCQACRSDGSTHYYKEIFNSWCVLDCEPGEYEVVSDNSCQACSAPCILCNSTSTTCQKCRNVTGTLYFYYAEECLTTCPNGYYGEATNNTCTLCHNACPLCFGPALTQCYSCQPDNSTGTDLYYYLEFGTTYCVQTCPYGQYATNATNTCQMCNINCATCEVNSTFCLTCTYVNTITIVYLYENACIITCPSGYWMNSTVQTDHQCSTCHEYCTVCTGPTNIECSQCGNQTVNGTLIQYYKDQSTTTCNPTCPDGQYIDDLVPNRCVPCDSSCVRCNVSSTNCFQCSFTGYFLYEPLNACVSQCPDNYYNDPTMTANYRYCTQCQAGCLTCDGAGLTNCQTCQNATDNGTTTNYYKEVSIDHCVAVCSNGYFGNAGTNICDPCNTGCVRCEFNASFCYECKSESGNDYYKPVDANSCVLVCPDGYYGNSTDYSCRTCIYFSLNGVCVLTCPADTFALRVDNSTTICKNCNDSDVTGNPCNQTYGFQIQTTVISGGSEMAHKVILDSAISANVTEA